MDIKRVVPLLKYILTAVGQKDPGHRELGAIYPIMGRESVREEQ